MATLLIAILVAVITALVVWLVARVVIKARLESAQQHNLASQEQSMAELKAALDDQIEKSLQQSQDFVTANLKGSQELMTEKFENLASKILDDKTKSFKEASSEGINQLLDPVKKQVKDFREKMESIHTEDTKQQTELKTVIDMLQKQNTRLSEDADNLSKALKGERQAQGSWGEMQLELALQTSGLERGREYELQPSFKGVGGNTLRPDAVVRLPDSKHIVIDAKVSLSAYARFVDADDDEAKEGELKSHCEALESRVDELSERGYEKIPDLGSPEVVFMFTPIESALQVALSRNPHFMSESLAKRIYVVTPSTLIPALAIVAQLWQLADQEKNTQEIVKQAEGLYDKAVLLVESMRNIGKNLDNTKNSYEEAIGRLVEGRGNLVKRASDIKGLGVSSTKSFPPEIVARAEAELEIDEPIGELEKAVLSPSSVTEESATDRNRTNNGLYD